MHDPISNPREQKIRLIVAMTWIVLLALITGYLIIDQPLPVQWIIAAVSDREGYFSPKVVGGIVFIVVAVVTFPLTLVANKILDRFLKKGSS